MKKQQLQNELAALDARRAEIVAALERDDGPWVPEEGDTVCPVTPSPTFPQYRKQWGEEWLRAGLIQPTPDAACRYAAWLERNAQLVTKALEMVGDWRPDMDSDYYTPVRPVGDDGVFEWSWLYSSSPKIGEIQFPTEELCQEFCDWANLHGVGL